MKKNILLFGVLAFSIIQNQAQTVTDIDGNVYNTVTIGTQVWMEENLKTTKYNDGTSIPNITDATSWNAISTGAYCDYNNTASNSISYGKLYNWYAVSDVRKICPTNWHVSSDTEWNVLTIFLDSTVDTSAIGYLGTDIGQKLKETGTAHWSFNTGATNSSGFTALPGGFRNDNGAGQSIGVYGLWWTATSFNSTYAWYRRLLGNFNTSKIERDYANILKTNGFSLRCVKDEITTGIEGMINENEIQIYPNPVIDKVTIDCNNRKGLKIQVYNLIGDCVFQSILTSSTNEIDISSLPSGMYVIRFTEADVTIQRKLIKN